MLLLNDEVQMRSTGLLEILLEVCRTGRIYFGRRNATVLKQCLGNAAAADEASMLTSS